MAAVAGWFHDAASIAPFYGGEQGVHIAAIALRHKLTVVTGNEKDFRRPGIKLFNPFEQDDAAD